MHLSVDNQEYTENIWIGGVRRRTRNEDLERLRVTVCCQPQKLRSLHSREATQRFPPGTATRVVVPLSASESVERKPGTALHGVYSLSSQDHQKVQGLGLQILKGKEEKHAFRVFCLISTPNIFQSIVKFGCVCKSTIHCTELQQTKQKNGASPKKKKEKRRGVSPGHAGSLERRLFF